MIDPQLFKFVELGSVAVLAIGLLGIVSNALNRMLRQQAAREIAQREADREWRREIVETQVKIAKVLDNHLSEVAANNQAILENLRQMNEISAESTRFMATTSKVLDDIQQRVLDAALGKRHATRRQKSR